MVPLGRTRRRSRTSNPSFAAPRARRVVLLGAVVNSGAAVGAIGAVGLPGAVAAATVGAALQLPAACGGAAARSFKLAAAALSRVAAACLRSRWMCLVLRLLLPLLLVRFRQLPSGFVVQARLSRDVRAAISRFVSVEASLLISVGSHFPRSAVACLCVVSDDVADMMTLLCRTRLVLGGVPRL